MNQAPAKKRSGRPLKFNPAGLDSFGSLVNFRPTNVRDSPSGSMSTSTNSAGPSLIRISTDDQQQSNSNGSLGAATIGLLDVFSACNGSFSFDKSLNPRRVLTKPSRPAFNSGHDNEKHDYILYVNDVIGNEEGRKYVILDLLGQGTFGQVVKCQRLKTGELVAVKVIKNQPAYFNQSMMEVTVLELLNGKHDPHDRHHIARMKDTFIFRQHLCVVVELLSLNLYELIKQNQYRGFSLQLCRVFLAQILDAMRILKEAKIVHCDLKPENILLKSLDSPGIKVIDYGSACHEQQTLYTYIQSRFYRSPEVLLGLPYTSAIDVWSLGCIAAELFLGLPIFPGASSYDQVSRIVETLGIPPTHMLELGRDAPLYFDKRPNLDGRPVRYTLKSRERYSMETGKQEPPSKKYFASSNLEDMILGYAFRPKDMSPADKEIEMRQRRVFVEFLRGLLKVSPVERWTPQQALQHPFITGKTTPALIPQPTISVPILQMPGAESGRIPIGAPAIPQSRQRPRANTLSSLSLQDVPPQIQKIASANKGQSSIPKTTARRPPPEAIPSTSDSEPPALPFEVGSVKSQTSLMQPGSLQFQQQQQQIDMGKLRGAKQAYYVDRLATFGNNRRVSNPPSMMSIRNSVRRPGRNDSLSLDEFPGPSSLPTVSSGAWPDQQQSSSGSQTDQQSPRRASSGRRASDPFLNQSGAQPIRGPNVGMARKGSLSSVGAPPPSSLSRSLTMSEMHQQQHFQPSSTMSGVASTTTSSSTIGSSSSSSYNMDTLEEVSEDDHHRTDDDDMDHDANQMDID